jgi:hypothetical protein
LFEYQRELFGPIWHLTLFFFLLSFLSKNVKPFSSHQQTIFITFHSQKKKNLKLILLLYHINPFLSHFSSKKHLTNAPYSCLSPEKIENLKCTFSLMLHIWYVMLSLLFIMFDINYVWFIIHILCFVIYMLIYYLLVIII